MKMKYLIFVLITLMLPQFAFAQTTGLEQKIADVMVWVVILVVPVVVIALFWKIHILPEEYAEKIHHPHTKAIQVLCILSIFFGGLLWPLAWVLAYSRPVFYKLAYGTDKSDDYFLDPNGKHADKPLNLSIVDDEISLLKEKLEGLTKRREEITGSKDVTSKTS